MVMHSHHDLNSHQFHPLTIPSDASSGPADAPTAQPLLLPLPGTPAGQPYSGDVQDASELPAGMHEPALSNRWTSLQSSSWDAFG